MALPIIEKLNPTNYSSWSVDIKFLLMEKNLWSYVDGSEPVLKSDVSEDVKNSYIQRQNQALSIIFLNIERDLKCVIEECEDPISAWKRLRGHFLPDSRALHMRKFSELMESRIKPGEAINVFGSRLRRIYNDICVIDKNFSEDYLTFQFLRYLPACYDPTVQFILRWSADKFNFEKVLNEVISEEVRLKLRDSDCVKSTAHSVVPNRNRRCWTCGQYGHLKSKCKKFFRREDPKNKSFPSVRSQSRRSSHSSPDSFNSDFSSSSKSSKNAVPDRPAARGHRPRFSRKSPNGHFSRRKWITKTTDDDGTRKFFFISSSNVDCDNCKDVWILDTGATHHFCYNKEMFSKYTPVTGEKMSVAIEDVTFPVEGRGEVKLRFGQRIYTLTNVMHSSQLRRNLLSGPQLDLNGVEFHGGHGEVRLSRGGEYYFSAFLKDRVYQLYPKPVFKKTVSFETSNLELLKKWHKRCGHISPALLSHTSKLKGVKGLPFLKDTKLFCESCKLGKFKSVSHKALQQIRSKRPLELLFSDVWGPCQVEGRTGERYFLTIIDDFSRRVSLYPMYLKSDAVDIIIKHITRAENFLNKKVKNFRSDNGGEFVNERLKDFFMAKGIKHEVTNVFTPQQNGVAERFMQTVTNGARTILLESKLDPSFWPEAMRYFVYTWNRICPHNLEKTPFELYGGNKPSIRHLKPFGITVYVGIPRQKRLKLDPKAKCGILVGYAFNTRGYRIWIPESNQILESSNLSFNEDSLGDLTRSGAVMGPCDYAFFSPDLGVNQGVTVEEDARVFPSSSSETHDSQIGEEGDIVSGSDSRTPSPIITLKDVDWLRKAVPCNTSKRVDIYFYEVGKDRRFRSSREIEDYCKQNNINFNSGTFDFNQSNRYSGPVTNPSVTESEDEESDSINSSLSSKS